MTMTMPPHPGHLLRCRILPDLGLSVTEFAEKLGMSRVSVSRVLNEKAGISSDFAVRLEHAGVGNARHWMSMQISYELWQAERNPRNHITKFVY